MPLFGLLAALACNKNVQGSTPADDQSSAEVVSTPDTPPSSTQPSQAEAGAEAGPDSGSGSGTPPSAHPDLTTLRTALVVQGGTYEVAPNLMLPEEWVECSTGEDCVALEGGCCNHCNGGFITAVSRQYADQVQPYLDRFGCKDSQECTEKACDKPREHAIVCMTRACILEDREPEIEEIWKEHIGIPGEVAGGIPGSSSGDPTILLPSSTPAPPSVSVDKPLAAVKARSIYTPDCDRTRLARTQAARFKKTPGKTSIRFCVSDSGKTTNVETTLEYRPDPEVDEICRNVVKKWRFKPFMDNDDPIEVCSEVTFEIRFD